MTGEQRRGDYYDNNNIDNIDDTDNNGFLNDRLRCRSVNNYLLFCLNRTRRHAKPNINYI